MSFLKKGINVRTNNLNSANEYQNFMNLNPDIVVVVAYGQIIPDIYLKKTGNFFKFTCIIITKMERSCADRKSNFK